MVPAAAGIYTLSLHDALPISGRAWAGGPGRRRVSPRSRAAGPSAVADPPPDARTAGPSRGGSATADGPAARLLRSEEHTSELQSHHELVCRLRLEQKKHQWQQ